MCVCVVECDDKKKVVKFPIIHPAAEIHCIHNRTTKNIAIYYCRSSESFPQKSQFFSPSSSTTTVVAACFYTRNTSGWLVKYIFRAAIRNTHTLVVLQKLVCALLAKLNTNIIGRNVFKVILSFNFITDLIPNCHPY